MCEQPQNFSKIKKYLTQLAFHRKSKSKVSDQNYSTFANHKGIYRSNKYVIQYTREKVTSFTEREKADLFVQSRPLKRFFIVPYGQESRYAPGYGFSTYKGYDVYEYSLNYHDIQDRSKVRLSTKVNDAIDFLYGKNMKETEEKVIDFLDIYHKTFIEDTHEFYQSYLNEMEVWNKKAGQDYQHKPGQLDEIKQHMRTIKAFSQQIQDMLCHYNSNLLKTTGKDSQRVTVLIDEFKNSLAK